MIRSIMKEKGISFSEIAKGTGLPLSIVENTIYQERKKNRDVILNFVKSKKVIKGVDNIKGDKRFQTLIASGFGYWEAFRICE